MFKRILAPVDLAHLETIQRALKITAEEAHHHNVPVTYISVADSAPGEIAHNPDEFSAKLKEREARTSKMSQQWAAHRDQNTERPKKSFFANNKKVEPKHWYDD